MDEESKTPAEIPLLQSSSRGSASAIQTLGNIIVSIVGTGILGLPFAFRVAGWGAGSLGVMIAGLCTYYCMRALVQCKDKLATEELVEEHKTYGDLGYKCLGTPGRCLTEFLIFISQCGGAVAYLVFIGQNLESIFNGHGLTCAEYIFLLVPIEIALSWIGSLSALAPSSIFADICNVLAMAIVLKEDVQKVMGGGFSFKDRKAFTDKIGGLPFAGGMAVFCFEGFGMTLALERSMKKKGAFSTLLAKVFTGITLVYVLFGFCGYMAYGDETKDIITLNLPRSWSAIAVQIGLCLGLVFTFPIMVHPVNEIVEDKLKKVHWFQKLHYNDNIALTRLAKVGIYLSRAILVVLLATLASCVPGFGIFASLVGSTVCALLSFVLPSAFHLKLLGPSLHPLQKTLDFCILFGGLLFAVYGTYSTVIGV
ncbi:aromatic and neutral transporter 1 family protein [Tripterygium wilfordii]|uniref:Aromatic and neutral transporter 1 family protein n=1 Tax=Tripterygium wilfordii TaxID=458696 RepID=A0A7J7DW71_TRIWF|nr:amino acid transporter ANT1 [Tripterygium wilfordii]KAF5750622.1 aromatic and neutral transporter 1 family protein [Tripterygium wilfordii]